MKIVAAVFADFEQTVLGGPSQLRAELGGQTVLGRTLGRLMRVQGLDGRCLFVRERDRGLAEDALRALGLADAIDVLPLDDGQRRRRELLRSGRKWNLYAWRGSPLGTTWFDEYVEPICVARVIDHYACDAVLCLDGHQPVLDADVASAMVAHQRAAPDEAPMVFTQAPPGVAGIILGRETVRQLLEGDIPLGLLLSYRPEIARGDLINRPACYHVDAGVAQTPARLTGDTRRSRELLSAALSDLGDDAPTTDVCSWLRLPGYDWAGPLPIEVELELTTAHPLPTSRLLPPRERVPVRALTDLAAVNRWAEELAAYDDRLVVLGGHGDPLAHPEFGEVCRRIRAAGACGLGVVTPLVELTDAQLETLLAQKVDFVKVRLDAHSAATYRDIHGADCFEQVIANIDRVQQVRRERVCAQPIVVPSFTRCAATLPEMEAFYDHWIRATGWAVIEGYNEYCGALPADTLLTTRPPVREACRRLGSRMMLLADGGVALCSQDFAGEQRLGDWRTTPITEIWAGQELARVRGFHAQLELGELPMCERCREWFRP